MTVGLHQVRVRLHPEVAVEVTANVARSTEEAEAQARGERPSAIDDDDVEAPEQQTDVAEQPAPSDDED